MGDPAGDGSAAAVAEFVEVVRRLRAECPWKAAQTHRSLARYLLEETYETLEALDAGDVAGLREELGDLLLQVVLHAAIAEQAGEFDLGDVARDITAKMVRRNPHVFAADGTPRRSEDQELTPDEVDEAWQRLKAQEKQRSDVLDGVPDALPALLHADKVVERLTRAGRAVAVEDGDDLGERLLGLVLEARSQGTDPEQALREAVRRRSG
jgi:XTP/dITP diphosphohydrolase